MLAVTIPPKTPACAPFTLRAPAPVTGCHLSSRELTGIPGARGAETGGSERRKGLLLLDLGGKGGAAAAGAGGGRSLSCGSTEAPHALVGRSRRGQGDRVGGRHQKGLEPLQGSSTALRQEYVSGTHQPQGPCSLPAPHAQDTAPAPRPLGQSAGGRLAGVGRGATEGSGCLGAPASQGDTAAVPAASRRGERSPQQPARRSGVGPSRSPARAGREPISGKLGPRQTRGTGEGEAGPRTHIRIPTPLPPAPHWGIRRQSAVPPRPAPASSGHSRPTRSTRSSTPTPTLAP